MASGAIGEFLMPCQLRGMWAARDSLSYMDVACRAAILSHFPLLFNRSNSGLLIFETIWLKINRFQDSRLVMFSGMSCCFKSSVPWANAFRRSSPLPISKWLLRCWKLWWKNDSLLVILSAREVAPMFVLASALP